MRRSMVVAAVIAIASPALAQQQERSVTASNGVPIHIVADDFAARYEYTAPKLPVGAGGYYFVAAIKTQTTTTPVMVTGSVYYDGEWRFYDQALFRGGEEVPAKFGDRDVIGCYGYRSCTHREGFQLTPTRDQIAKYGGQDGMLDVQLRARGLEPVMVRVPLSYIAAVGEVAGIARAEPKPAPPPVTPPPQTATHGQLEWLYHTYGEPGWQPPPKAPAPAAKNPAVRCVTCR